MPFKFHQLAAATAFICFVLAAVWLLAPQLLLAIWAVDYAYPVGLVSRRAAALFLGIGVMFWLAREVPHPARRALGTGLGVACLTLAALGVFELLTGHAGPGILLAVGVELALAAAWLGLVRGEKAALRRRA